MDEGRPIFRARACLGVWVRLGGQCPGQVWSIAVNPMGFPGLQGAGQQTLPKGWGWGHPPSWNGSPVRPWLFILCVRIACVPQWEPCNSSPAASGRSEIPSIAHGCNLGTHIPRSPEVWVLETAYILHQGRSCKQKFLIFKEDQKHFRIQTW